MRLTGWMTTGSGRVRGPCQYRLRTLFLLLTAASGWLAWRAHLTHEQECAVAALQEIGVDVTRKAREPSWLWSLLGERFGQTIVGAVLKDARDAEKAVAHLQELPDLEDIDLWVLPWDETRGSDAERLFRCQMPGARIQCSFLMFGYTTQTETVRVPDGAALLLDGIKVLKERQSQDVGRD
jgi:hypothetical protein